MTNDLHHLPLLQDQIAIVTGSAQGIGAGIAEALGGFGATVVIADLDGARAVARAEELVTSGVSAIGVAHDVTSSESGAALAERVLDELGRIDLLVNNAGISGRVPLDEMDDRTWDAMISVNLTGVARTSRAVVPAMKRQGHGNIISVSSVAGRSGKANMTHYCSSKFGVIGFTQSLALELALTGVRANAVCPGIVRTAMWDIELAEISEARNISIDKAWTETLAGIPLNRPQTPADIGNAVAFLASPLAGNITGQSLNVDGGFEMN